MGIEIITQVRACFFPSPFLPPSALPFLTTCMTPQVQRILDENERLARESQEKQHKVELLQQKIQSLHEKNERFIGGLWGFFSLCVSLSMNSN